MAVVPYPVTDPDAIRRAVRGEQPGAAGAIADGAIADGAVPEGADGAEGLLKRIVADLDRAPAIVVEHAEFGHYGSGYASFVDVSLTSRDGSRRHGDDHYTEVVCLPVCLCRLAPVATLHRPGTRGRSRDGKRGHSYMPGLSTATTAPVAGWEQESREAAGILEHHGIELLSPEVLARPIDPAVHVETNLADGGPPFTVFDAWFYWYD